MVAVIEKFSHLRYNACLLHQPIERLHHPPLISIGTLQKIFLSGNYRLMPHEFFERMYRMALSSSGILRERASHKARGSVACCLVLISWFSEKSVSPAHPATCSIGRRSSENCRPQLTIPARMNHLMHPCRKHTNEDGSSDIRVCNKLHTLRLDSRLRGDDNNGHRNDTNGQSARNNCL